LGSVHGSRRGFGDIALSFSILFHSSSSPESVPE
jgi:hypothetical protein